VDKVRGVAGVERDREIERLCGFFVVVRGCEMMMIDES
jgi:hypothetical protein